MHQGVINILVYHYLRCIIESFLLLETFGNTNRPTEIENNISNEIFKITTWLHSKKLKLNASKSKFMIFFKHLKIIPKLNILANGNPI